MDMSKKYKELLKAVQAIVVGVHNQAISEFEEAMVKGLGPSDPGPSLDWVFNLIKDVASKLRVS
jgi:hypothetical protein